MKYKYLYQYPYGIKVTIKNKDYYYIGKSSLDNEKMFWDNYKIIYESDIFADEDYENEEIFLHTFKADEAIKKMYDAYTALFLSLVAEEPFVLENDLENLAKTISEIKKILD